MWDFREIVLKHGLGEARRMAGTATERACVDAAWAMLEPPRGDDRVYASRIVTTLPHRRGRSMREWRREADDDGIYTWRSGAHDRAETGVPSGAKARIMLLHLLNEAIRSGSTAVAVGGSMYEWARIVSHSLGGQTYSLVAEQSMAIATCHLDIALPKGAGASSICGPLVEEIVGIEPPRGAAPGARSHSPAAWPMDFPVLVRINARILRHVESRSILIRRSALDQIRNNSAAIDLYVRLSARLPRLQVPVLATWDEIAGRLGAGYKNKRHLKADVHELLQLVTAVYPEANVEVGAHGVVLSPSRPPIVGPESGSARATCESLPYARPA